MCSLPISFQTFICKQEHIPVLIQTTKGSYHTHSCVICFMHLITYFGHLFMSVEQKQTKITILQWSLSPLTGVPCLPNSVRFPECAARSQTSVALYWNGFSSFMGAQYTFTFCEAFPALRKELCFLPSSPNILGILFSSHSSQGFVDAHLLAFFF